MSVWIWIGLALAVVFVLWRLNLRAHGTWVDLPSDPHEFVKPEYAPLIDWLANEVETQIGRENIIAGNAFALSTLNEALETALADRGGISQIEISIPEFTHDAEGALDFRIVVDQEQLEKFNL